MTASEIRKQLDGLLLSRRPEPKDGFYNFQVTEVIQNGDKTLYPTFTIKLNPSDVEIIENGSSYQIFPKQKILDKLESVCRRDGVVDLMLYPNL